jgi:hypothetical protein
MGEIHVSPALVPPSLEKIVLAKEAIAAGLIPTRIEPMNCAHGPCYQFQLWEPSGSLWAEASHEDADDIRENIEMWRRAVAENEIIERRNPCAESCSNPAAHAEGGHDV